MKQFLIKSIGLTVILFILGSILYSTILKAYFFRDLLFLVLFFFIVTNLVHAYLLKIAGKSSSRFTSLYMATSFIKMFFYIAIAVTYVIFFRENSKVFIANFLLLYTVYTIFEVYEFLKVVKQLK